GRRVHADLTVEGCAADTSPRAPWGRPVTAPGASTCTVAVAWAGRGVQYPALVDPAWVSTKNMVVERAHHALAMLPNPATPPGNAPHPAAPARDREPGVGAGRLRQEQPPAALGRDLRAAQPHLRRDRADEQASRRSHGDGDPCERVRPYPRRRRRGLPRRS